MTGKVDDWEDGVGQSGGSSSERFEETYHRKERSEAKSYRKMITAKDRSKFKKTDLSKHQEQADKLAVSKLDVDNLVRGRVVSISSQGSAHGVVVNANGRKITCILRGALKQDKMQLKNPVTVGDFVLFEATSEEEGAIAYVEPRTTVLSRADNLSRRKEHLIAANVEQVLITACVVDPPLKPFLVDRYIIAAQRGGMDPVVVLNKVDLLQLAVEDKESLSLQILAEQILYAEFVEGYRAAGVKVVSVSVVDGTGLDELRKIMQDKTSVFSGQSGVGKSSLINAVTGSDLRVGRTVEKTGKGSHTTTSAQLLPLDLGGWCVDTPGIKSFGVWDLKRNEVEAYFEEIHAKGIDCKFADCMHLHEEGCAVLAALEAEELSLIRYESYQSLMASLAQEHRRR